MKSIELPTSVTSIGNYAFNSCTSLVAVELPSSVKTIGSNAFAENSNLKTVTIKEGLTSIGTLAFLRCSSLEEIYIPSTLTSLGSRAFYTCNKLSFVVSGSNSLYASIDGVLFNKNFTQLIWYGKSSINKSYTVPDGVTSLGEYSFATTVVEQVTLPSSLKNINGAAFHSSKELTTIISNATVAMSVASNGFGSSGNYAGQNNYNKGTNKLYLPINAIGYESDMWLDPLQNADKCGFSIHGKLTIASNRSNAQFDVKYTTTSGSSKTVTVGVGTCYLSDIKYGTSLTATPKALGDYSFDVSSTTITYNGATTITNNAYIYPKNATIVGVQNPVENPTYTWTTTTANVDGAYTATWSISDNLKSYMSISSQNNTQCVMNVSNAPTAVVNGTLTLTIKKNYDNSTVLTATKSIALQKIIRPTGVSINGDSTIYYKGYTHTYNVAVTPNDVNVTYSTSWKLSSTSNVEIASSNNSSCTLKVKNEVSSNTTITLTATVTTSDGVTTVSGTKTITLAKVVRPTSLSFTSGDSEVRFVGNYAYVVAPSTTPTNVTLTYATPTLSGTAVTQGKVALVSGNNGTIVILVSSESTSDLTFTINQSATVGGGGATISASKTVTLKSVIRPTGVTIDGPSSIIGGESATYTATIAPSTTNVDVTYTWSISGSSNASISSTSGNSCSISTTTVVEEESFILTCTIYDGKNYISSTHNCAITIFVINNGVYIQHIDGTLYLEDEWDEGGFANKEANGVAVVSDEVRFVVAKQLASSSKLPWGGYNKNTGQFRYGSLSDALRDLDGQNNTTLILGALSGVSDMYGVDGAPAAEACVNYTFPNGSTGYLPALGELKLISDNISIISTMFSSIGAISIPNDNFTSSTIPSNRDSFSINLRSGTTSTTSRPNENYVIACTPLI